MTNQPTPRINVTLGLSPDEWARAHIIKTRGIKIIDIFRAGLELYETKTVKK